MTATTVPTPTAGDPGGRDGASLIGLWDPASGRFDPVRLRRALVLRCWSPDDLAREAGIGRTTAYKALAGEGVRDAIAIKILSALKRHPPVLTDID